MPERRGWLYLGLAGVVMTGLAVLSALAHGTVRLAFLSGIGAIVAIAVAWLTLDYPIRRLYRWRNWTGSPRCRHLPLLRGESTLCCVLEHRGDSVTSASVKVHFRSGERKHIDLGETDPEGFATLCEIEPLGPMRITWYATRLGHSGNQVVGVDHYPRLSDRLPLNWRRRIAELRRD